MTKEEILKRLDVLPKGGITIKMIKKAKGQAYSYPYLQWSEKANNVRVGSAKVKFLRRGLYWKNASVSRSG